MGYAKESTLTSPVQAGHSIILTADMEVIADQVHQRGVRTKISGPYEESLLDQKMFDLLEARYLFIYLSL